MNRIQEERAPAAPHFAAVRRPRAEESLGGRSEELACSLFAPVHYEPRYAYPLIVWLHGPARDERELFEVLPRISVRNYVALAPRGTTMLASPKSGRRVFASWSQSEIEIAEAQRRVFAAIELAARRYHVRRSLVFLAGFDCGGTMALRIAANAPRRFAGVISLGGPFPNGGTPLARFEELRRVPMFLAYGRESRICRTQQVCDNLRLLHSAGVEVSLRQYPGGHQVSATMLADVDRWVMERVCGGACS